MPRYVKSKKSGKWKKSYKRNINTKKKLDSAVLKRRKNVKSMQRAKEMEEMHRKQKLIEDKYRLENQSSAMGFELGLPMTEHASFEEADAFDTEEEDAYDVLVSKLLAKEGVRGARERKNEVDSSSSDEDSNVGEVPEEDTEVYREEADPDVGTDIEEETDSEDDQIKKVKLQQDKLKKYEPIAEEAEQSEEELEIDSDDYTAQEDIIALNNVNKKKPLKTLFDTTQTTSKTEETHHGTFAVHLDYELPSEEVEKLLSTKEPKKKFNLQWPGIGQFVVEFPQVARPVSQTERLAQLYNSDIEELPKNILISEQLQALNVRTTLVTNAPIPFTQLQTELFTIFNQYQDLLYPERTPSNASEIRSMYCLHTLNHMMKTRARILHHNAKLSAAKAKTANKKGSSEPPRSVDSYALVPDSYRDQGLMRPKVLIVLPFRESAYQVVRTMAQLLFGNDAMENGAINKAVMHYDRFVTEYSGQTLRLSKTNPKPEDYEQIFTGNTDDNFRLGISLTKKCFKLYTDFYASDILLTSPLGLRMIIGAPGSAERDYDYLNSIELLIVDQAELILAQNWENLLHIVEHLHLQPQKLRDTDFQRVRPWCLSGLGRFYRQTLLFCSHELPEFRGLFSRQCNNYEGAVRVFNPITVDHLRHLVVPTAQMFERVEVSSLEEAFEQRFRHFIRAVLPRYRAPSHAHCMIYVPSYFDFVRLRNYFKAETINFVQICEYTPQGKMARARDIFYHSGAHFLLYSERAHFYRRTRIKGIRHLIMYQPPVWPHFYPEMVNLMQNANQNARDGLKDSMSVTVLYTKYDLLQLKGILGSEVATKLVLSGQKTHTFTAE